MDYTTHNRQAYFPYKDLNGKSHRGIPAVHHFNDGVLLLTGPDALVCVTGTTMLAASGRGKGVASACPLCGEATKDLRSHMGGHRPSVNSHIP